MMGPLDVDTHPCGPHRLREVFGPPNDPDVDSFFFPAELRCSLGRAERKNAIALAAAVDA
jgi:hypothetical protein